MVRLGLFLWLLAASCLCLAQKPCGIFATRASFVNNSVTFPVADGCEIDVRTNKDLVAQQGKEKVRFKFNHLYGYADGQHKYRAYGRQALLADHAYYKVIYTAGIVIYSRRTRDYRANRYTAYYYSKRLDSPILPLKRKFITRDTRHSVPQVTIDVYGLKQRLGLNTGAASDTLRLQLEEPIL